MDKNTFLTTHRDSHKWPYPKPLVPVPAEPPIKTKPSNFYVAKLIEPYCHCDYHLYEPEMGRYKKLAEKETKLNEELAKLKQRVRNPSYALFLDARELCKLWPLWYCGTVSMTIVNGLESDRQIDSTCA